MSDKEKIRIVNTPIRGEVCPDRTYDMKTECSTLSSVYLSGADSAKVINFFCHSGNYQNCPTYKERHK